MKSGYTLRWGQMSKTGQGLLNNDKEDQIIDGSELKNLWGKFILISLACFNPYFPDKIKKSFP